MNRGAEPNTNTTIGFLNAIGDLDWPSSVFLSVVIAVATIATALVIPYLGQTRLKLAKAGVELKPIRWTLIAFAAIGGFVVLTAMGFLAADDRSGVILLYLGILSGYAASIKEIELANVNVDDLQAELNAAKKKLADTQRQLDEAKERISEFERSEVSTDR